SWAAWPPTPARSSPGTSCSTPRKTSRRRNTSSVRCRRRRLPGRAGPSSFESRRGETARPRVFVSRSPEQRARNVNIEMGGMFVALARSLSMKPTLPFVLLAGLLLSLLAPPGPAAESTDRLLRKASAVLAQLEGEIVLPGLKEPVEVLRDRWGVPHIYARSQDDLFFAQGFVAAQDRLFQIDLWRRVGMGETAEVIGRE